MLRACVVVAIVACSSPPAKPRVTPPTTPVAAAPALPPGVLARTQGAQGTIEVIERDGLRMLVIDGAVHAAVPVGQTPAANDPLVGILRRVRPAAKTALVIGLGSGRTATQLASAGLDVTAVELEPAVVEYARTYFGFRGKAVVGDGLAFAEKATERWDLVVVDALSAVGLPAPFVERATVKLLRSRLNGKAAVLAVRMVDKPASTAARAYLQRDGDWRFHLFLGSGIGDEQQNLYVLDGESPLSLDADPAVPVWPLAVPGRTVQPVPTAREVTLLGYLVRVGPEKTLCLDLLHWEMGAVRFVIAPGSALAGELGKLAPAGESPSSGDIPSDGNTAKTLHGALGGADFKRSDVRYSPTVVVLRGTATFRSAIDADDLDRIRGYDKDSTGPTLLAWGGVLYGLEPKELAWKLTLADWQKLHAQSLAPAAKRLLAASRRVDIPAMRTAAADYVKAIETALGEWAPKFQTHQSMQALARALADLDAKDRRATCEKIVEAINNVGEGYWVNPDLRPVAAGLAKCAGID